MVYPMHHVLGIIPNPDDISQALSEGRCVVAVRAYHHLDWDAIKQVLSGHGGRFIHFYGWMIHDLEP